MQKTALFDYEVDVVILNISAAALMIGTNIAPSGKKFGVSNIMRIEVFLTCHMRHQKIPSVSILLSCAWLVTRFGSSVINPFLCKVPRSRLTSCWAWLLLC